MSRGESLMFRNDICTEEFNRNSGSLSKRVLRKLASSYVIIIPL